AVELGWAGLGEVATGDGIEHPAHLDGRRGHVVEELVDSSEHRVPIAGKLRGGRTLPDSPGPADVALDPSQLAQGLPVRVDDVVEGGDDLAPGAIGRVGAH